VTLPGDTYADGPRPQVAEEAWGSAPPAAPPVTTDSRAVVALVLAVASFVILPLLAAIGALVLARQSRRAIAASRGQLSGDGLVAAARILAWINIALCVLAVLAVVGMFTLFAVYGFT
jgi:hypothetical protein